MLTVLPSVLNKCQEAENFWAFYIPNHGGVGQMCGLCTSFGVAVATFSVLGDFLRTGGKLVWNWGQSPGVQRVFLIISTSRLLVGVI
jgi:hypothetical protein